MRLEDVPAFMPGPTQVVVRIRAAGVNPVDTYVRAGTYAIKPPLPYTPGSDGAGEVEAVGADVKSFKPGDRVYIANDNSGLPRTGTYAEQALCQHTQLHALPANVSFAQGAAMGVPYATAYRALFMRANAKPGETVLIHGASGGVGIAAVQTRARPRHAHHRHRRQRSRHGRGPPSRRGHRGQPQGPALRRCDHESDRRQGRGRRPRDARPRESRQGSRPHRALRPHRRHRQPGPRGNRSARHDGQGRRDPRHDLVQHHAARTGRRFTPRWSRACATRRSSRWSAARYRCPTPRRRTTR